MPAARPLLALLAVGAFLAPAALAATKPKPTPVPGALVRKHTPAGMAAARAALLDVHALGEGWRATAKPATSASLSCPAWEPALGGIVETGAASSDGFRASATGPFLAQSAWVYRGAAQEAAYWRRVVRGGVLDCLSAAVQQGSTRDVVFSVVGRTRIALPRLAPHVAGYRVAATATSAAQVVRVYYDLLVLGRGAAVTELTWAQFAAPPKRAQELAVARLAARRLG